MFSNSVELILGDRLSRGDRAPPYPPDARAPALRPRARRRGREDPERVRRRSARAALGAEQVPAGEGRAVPARPAAGARADAGLPPHAADRRAARAERQPARGAGRRPARRDAAAAQVVRLAAARGPGRHAPRHPQLHQPRHRQGAADLDGSPRRRASDGDAPAGQGEEGKAVGPRSARRLHHQPVGARRGRRARSADRPHATSCSARWRCSAAGARTTRCSSAKPASARPRWPKAWRSGCCRTTCRRSSRAPRSTRSTRRRCSPARASAATSRSASRPSSPRSPSAAKPILFIDEVHSTVGAGATTGGTMDLATLIKPVLTAGELRVVGSTTFEEFKQIEKDRGARAPAAEDRRRRAVGRRDRADPQGAAVALRAAPQRDLHGRRARRRRQARRAAPARLAAARQRHRHPGRSRRHAAPAAGSARAAAGGRRPRRGRRRREGRQATAVEGAAAHRRRRRDREGRRAHRPHPREAGVVVGQGAPQGPRGLAQPRRVRPGRRRAHGRHVDQARPRRPRPARQAGRLLPLHRPDRRRQDRARQAARAAPRQRVHRAST